MSENQVMARVPDDHPLMIAWVEHQKTDEYANTIRWYGELSTGALWASFMAGWLRAGGQSPA